MPNPFCYSFTHRAIPPDLTERFAMSDLELFQGSDWVGIGYPDPTTLAVSYCLMRGRTDGDCLVFIVRWDECDKVLGAKLVGSWATVDEAIAGVAKRRGDKPQVSFMI